MRKKRAPILPEERHKRDYPVAPQGLETVTPLRHRVGRASPPNGNDKARIRSKLLRRVSRRVDAKTIKGCSPGLRIVIAKGQRFDADRAQTGQSLAAQFTGAE